MRSQLTAGDTTAAFSAWQRWPGYALLWQPQQAGPQGGSAAQGRKDRPGADRDEPGPGNYRQHPGIHMPGNPAPRQHTQPPASPPSAAAQTRAAEDAAKINQGLCFALAANSTVASWVLSPSSAMKMVANTASKDLKSINPLRGRCSRAARTRRSAATPGSPRASAGSRAPPARNRARTAGTGDRRRTACN